MGLVIGIIVGALVVTAPVATLAFTAVMSHQFKRKGFKIRVGE